MKGLSFIIEFAAIAGFAVTWCLGVYLVILRTMLKARGILPMRYRITGAEVATIRKSATDAEAKRRLDRFLRVYRWFWIAFGVTVVMWCLWYGMGFA